MLQCHCNKVETLWIIYFHPCKACQSLSVYSWLYIIQFLCACVGCYNTPDRAVALQARASFAPCLQKKRSRPSERWDVGSKRMWISWQPCSG